MCVCSFRIVCVSICSSLSLFCISFFFLFSCFQSSSTFILHFFFFFSFSYLCFVRIPGYSLQHRIIIIANASRKSIPTSPTHSPLPSIRSKRLPCSNTSNNDSAVALLCLSLCSALERHNCVRGFSFQSLSHFWSFRRGELTQELAEQPRQKKQRSPKGLKLLTCILPGAIAAIKLYFFFAPYLRIGTTNKNKGSCALVVLLLLLFCVCATYTDSLSNSDFRVSFESTAVYAHKPSQFPTAKV